MVDATMLRVKFQKVPEKIKRFVVDEIEKQAAKVVADMKRLVPVDSGALRDSINWTWGDAPKGSITLGTVRGRTNARISVTIYAGTRDKSLGSADAFYARFQEFGTVKMAANPFFFPAWRANKPRVNAALKRAVGRALKSA
jgi:HK97 gp10 family phage protein